MTTQYVPGLEVCVSIVPWMIKVYPKCLHNSFADELESYTSDLLQITSMAVSI